MESDLLVAGEAFEDLVFHDLPRLPRLGEELKTEHFHRTVGGGVLITATAARRLGTRTRVASALGASAERHLAREGIAFDNVRRPEETEALTVVLSTRGERAFVTYEGANRLLEERLLERLRSASARHLHLALAPERLEGWIDLLGGFRRDGVTLSWDLGWNPCLREELDGLWELFAALDVLFLNEAEAKLYGGKESLSEALASLGGLARLTLVKRGALGCLWTEATRQGELHGIEVEVVDTTGAGDAFDGAYLHALLAGLDLEDRLRLANRVGALSTRRPGGIDGLPRKDELP